MQMVAFIDASQLAHDTQIGMIGDSVMVGLQRSACLVDEPKVEYYVSEFKRRFPGILITVPPEAEDGIKLILLAPPDHRSN